MRVPSRSIALRSSIAARTGSPWRARLKKERVEEALAEPAQDRIALCRGDEDVLISNIGDRPNDRESVLEPPSYQPRGQRRRRRPLRSLGRASTLRWCGGTEAAPWRRRALWPGNAVRPGSGL